MNLRFDSKSIRIRVSQEEAEKLASEKQIREQLPFPEENLNVIISCTEGTDLTLNENFEMNVPYQDLQRILQASSKEDELRGNFTSHSLQAELRFEIDRFTRKKVKNLS